MTHQPSLIARADTLLGVCQGLGEELGVDPLLFRIAFALALFLDPVAVIAVYLVLGAALALFRWAFPPRRAALPDAPATATAPRGDNDDGEVSFAEVA